MLIPYRTHLNLSLAGFRGHYWHPCESRRVTGGPKAWRPRKQCVQLKMNDSWE